MKHLRKDIRVAITRLTTLSFDLENSSRTPDQRAETLVEFDSQLEAVQYILELLDKEVQIVKGSMGVPAEEGGMKNTSCNICSRSFADHVEMDHPYEVRGTELKHGDLDLVVSESGAVYQASKNGELLGYAVQEADGRFQGHFADEDFSTEPTRCFGLPLSLCWDFAH